MNTNEYKINYKLRKFNLLIDEGGETRRLWVGYVGQNDKLTDDISLAKVYTRDDLETIFSPDEVYELEYQSHTTLSLIPECEELDKIFKQITDIKKANFQFGIKTHITIDGLEGDITTYQEIRKTTHMLPRKVDGKYITDGKGHGVLFDTPSTQLDFVLEWNGYKAFWGGVKPEMAKLNLTDKIRKHYNYGDPFKFIQKNDKRRVWKNS